MPDGDGVRLRLAHLYADVMNVYGDRGNAIALQYRCEARGIALDVDGVGIGEELDPASYDLLIVGGGRIGSSAASPVTWWRGARRSGRPSRKGCRRWRSVGDSSCSAGIMSIRMGTCCPASGLFHMETRHPGEGAERAIGNVLLRTDLGEVVGFENHGGRTWLDEGQEAFGIVIAGRGNNGEDGSEGARVANAIGTYLHGSLLPKNPAIADFLLGKALTRRYGEGATLEALDDSLEESAHRAASATTRRGEGARRRLRGLLRR